METDRIKEQMSRAAGAMQETGREAKEQAQQTGSELKAAAGEWSQQAADKAGDFGREAESYMRENPWPTAVMVGLFAFGIGYLMGTRAGRR